MPRDLSNAAFKWGAVALLVALSSGVHAQTTVAGFTPESFRVTESGATEYRIPIRVPPGIAGLEPKLELLYNSQAGNGMLGMGWSLSGLSNIARCPSTKAQDGAGGPIISFESLNRFCLEGQKLMMIAGTSYGADGAEYRTEMDGFTKIVSLGAAGIGPASFKAWTKSGLILEFGNTADSRIEAQGNASVRVWAVNRIQDTKGNYLTVSYAEDNPNGDYQLTRVDYTKNDAAGLVAGQSVRFTYEARSDIAPLYVGGSVMKTLNRLTNVKTYIGETLVKDYRITYDNLGTAGRSRVTSIQECAGDASCLPPISLGWLTESASTRNFDGPASGDWTGHGNGVTRNLVGDFNGDGKQDLLGYEADAQSTFFNVCISNGGGFTCTAWNASNKSVSTGLTVGDFNADGKADVAGYSGGVFYSPTYVTFDIMVCINNGASFSCSDWVAEVVGGDPLSFDFLSNRIVADFTGDGRSDWALWDPNNSLWRVCTTTGPSSMDCAHVMTGPTPGVGNNTLGDFNGDGLADLAGYAGGSSWNVCLSYGSGFFTCPTWTGHSGGISNNISKDFNGDGLTDLAQYVSGSDWNVCLSTGAWLFSCSTWSGVSATVENTRSGDFNGDGKADLAAQVSPGTWNVCLSTGTGFSCSSWSGTTATVASTVTADLNGDGKEDLSGNTSASTWNTTLSGVPLPDRLQTITSGLGAVTGLTYLPLTDSAVYTKDTGAIYPQLDLQAPAYVVSSHTQSDGIGGNVQTDYAYTGAKVDLTGRGFLGFRQVQSTFVPTGIKRLVTYRQDWPFVGLPSLMKTMQSSGAVLSQTDSSYECMNPVGGGACTVAAGNRYFPYLTQSVQTGNDLNGATLPTVTTTRSGIDLYGNVGTVTVSTGDGYSKTTTNTYANDAANWILGRLTRSTTVSTDVLAIEVGSNQQNLNLRTLYDSLGSPPTGGEKIEFIVAEGVYITSTSTTIPAITTGTWPAGVELTLRNKGFIMGRGGNGGGYGTQSNGFTGGSAISLGLSVTIDSAMGYILGGGGGGGSGNANTIGGGGGAGGGTGGTGSNGSVFGYGGAGGGPGSSGSNGSRAGIGFAFYYVGGGGGGRVVPSSTTNGPTVSSQTSAPGYGGSGGGTGGAHSIFYTGGSATGGAGGGPGVAGGNGVQSGTWPQASGGGGGWGSAGGGGTSGPAGSGGAGGAGGKAIELNGYSVSWEGGFPTGHVYGAVTQ